MRLGLATSTAVAFAITVAHAYVTADNYVWENVKIGGGGGFVPGIIFNQGTKGVAFAR